VALVAATAVHAGFQVTVSRLVYPALAAVPPQSWATGHALHSRRITPLVAVIYLLVLVTVAGALVGSRTGATLVAAGASLAVLAVTALLAAPLHRRLGQGHDPALLHRLTRVDRWRSVGAVVALAAALVAHLG
jgi:hypothetical protein